MPDSRRLARLSRIGAAALAVVFVREFCELCRRPRRPGRRPYRRPARADCQPVPRPIYRRPDPLIYDQYYLMAQGIAVTWDNPDISIEQNGVPVDAHALQPDTEYDVIARIWNGSTSAPVVGMPVHFSYLTFGIGTQSTPIGTALADVGVKGSAACPGHARYRWRTPSAAGHYCLQVVLDWPEDANPGNNLGQTNTDVQELSSPAEFRFPVRNADRRARTLTLRADGYALPPLPRCDEREQRRRAGDDLAQRLERLQVNHGYRRQELPDGWQVRIEPGELRLGPGEEREVTVVVTAPDGFAGRRAVNVNAFAGPVLVGGVTLIAVGRA